MLPIAFTVYFLHLQHESAQDSFFALFPERSQHRVVQILPFYSYVCVMKQKLKYVQCWRRNIFNLYRARKTSLFKPGPLHSISPSHAFARQPKGFGVRTCRGHLFKIVQTKNRIRARARKDKRVLQKEI